MPRHVSSRRLSELAGAVGEAKIKNLSRRECSRFHTALRLTRSLYGPERDASEVRFESTTFGHSASKATVRFRSIFETLRSGPCSSESRITLRADSRRSHGVDHDQRCFTPRSSSARSRLAASQRVGCG